MGNIDPVVLTTAEYVARTSKRNYQSIDVFYLILFSETRRQNA